MEESVRTMSQEYFKGNRDKKFQYTLIIAQDTWQEPNNAWQNTKMFPAVLATILLLSYKGVMLTLLSQLTHQINQRSSRVPNL